MSFYFSETQSLNDCKRGLVIPKPSADLANFLGILSGDGYIYHCRKYHKYIIEIVGNRLNDRQFLLNHVVNLFERLFHIIPHVYDRKSCNVMMIIARSKGLYNFLKGIGFPSGKKTGLHIPDWAAQSEECTRAFVRGIFDTDGSLCLKKNHGKREFYPVVHIALKEERLIREIAAWAREHGMSQYVGRYSYIDGRTNKQYTKFNLQISGYKNVGIWMKLVGTDNPHHLNKWRKTNEWDERDLNPRSHELQSCAFPG